MSMCLFTEFQIIFFYLIPDQNIKAFFRKIFKSKSLLVKEPTASDELQKSR